MHAGASGQKGSEIDDGAAIIDAAQTCLNTQRPLAAPVRVYFWPITHGQQSSSPIGTLLAGRARARV